MDYSGNDGVCVSVIVPAYNVEQYIARTIESVMQQDLESLELIVVNDGSDDDTLGAIERTLSGSNIRRRIICQENQGVSCARNRGLDCASGEYVFFLDADDFTDPSCLSRLYSAAVDQNADIAYCGFDRVDENGNQLEAYVDHYRYLMPSTGTDVAMMMLIGFTWLWTGSVLYRKKMLDDHLVRYAVGCALGEDQEFILKALFHSNKVVSVSETLSYYFQRDSSVTGQSTWEKQLKVLHVWERLLCYLDTHEADRGLIDSLRNYKIPCEAMNIIPSMVVGGCSDDEIIDKLQNTDIHTSIRLSRCPWRLMGMRGVKWWLKNHIIRAFPRLYLKLYRFKTQRSGFF